MIIGAVEVRVIRAAWIRTVSARTILFGNQLTISILSSRWMDFAASKHSAKSIGLKVKALIASQLLKIKMRVHSVDASVWGVKCGRSGYCNSSSAGSIASESWESGLSDEVAVAEPPGVDRILKRDGAGVDVEYVFLHQSFF